MPNHCIFELGSLCMIYGLFIHNRKRINVSSKTLTFNNLHKMTIKVKISLGIFKYLFFICQTVWPNYIGKLKILRFGLSRPNVSTLKNFANGYYFTNISY